MLVEYAYGLDAGYYLVDQFQSFCGGADVKLLQAWKPILIGLFTFTSIQYFSRPSTVKCKKKSTQTMDEYQRPERLEPLKTLHETRANDQYSKLINSTEVYKLT